MDATLVVAEPQVKQRRAKYDYSQLAPVSVHLPWCKSCGICVDLCAKNVLVAASDGKPRVVNAEECTQCGTCWMHCPDNAIVSNHR